MRFTLIKVLVFVATVASLAPAARALTLECTDGSQTLTLNVEEKTFAINGEVISEARISEIKGPRHRQGTDGYSAEIRKSASPLSPRKVYKFWTRTCDEQTAFVQLYVGSGTGADVAQGPEISCQCSE